MLCIKVDFYFKIEKNGLEKVILFFFILIFAWIRPMGERVYCPLAVGFK
jgi:hypothetical protein